MNLYFSLMKKKAYYLCRSQEAHIIFKAGKVMMITLTVQTCVHRLNGPSKILKTIFQDTRKELRMHSQLETCPSFQSFGGQASAKCAMVFFQMGNHNISIMQTTIPNAWSIQSNEGYPRGTRLQRGSQFMSQVSGIQMPRPES